MDSREVLASPLLGGAVPTKGNAWWARLALYSSHVLAAWGHRSWEFAVGLLMLQLRPGSLALVSPTAWRTTWARWSLVRLSALTSPSESQQIYFLLDARCAARDARIDDHALHLKRVR